jgi:hypothetical protein
MILQFLALTLAGAIVGTPRGEALRWARGRHWFGRLVVTSPYTLCNGQRLYLWASGRPPFDLYDVRVSA